MATLQQLYYYSFRTIQGSAIARSIYAAGIYWVITAYADGQFSLLWWTLLIQGVVGFVLGQIALWRIAPQSYQFRILSLEWKYQVLAFGGIITGVLPLIANLRGFSYSVINQASLPLLGLLAAVIDYRRKVSEERKKDPEAKVPFHSTNFQVVGLLLVIPMFMLIEGNQLNIGNLRSMGHAKLVEGALYGILYVVVFNGKDWLTRKVKQARSMNFALEESLNPILASPIYYKAAAENIAATSPGIALVGFIGVLVGPSEQQHLAFEVVWRVAGLSVFLVAALFAEQSIMRPKGGFRENSTIILSRVVWGALIGGIFGVKEVNIFLFAGVLCATVGLSIQWKAFERRRLKQEAAVLAGIKE